MKGKGLSFYMSHAKIMHVHIKGQIVIYIVQSIFSLEDSTTGQVCNLLELCSGVVSAVCVGRSVFHFGVAEQVPYSWKSVNWEDTTISRKKPSQNASSYLGYINHA